MTDHNYWLAAWLTVMAVWIAASFLRVYQQHLNVGFECLAGVIAFALNIFAALYCAGFVVVMP